MRKLGIILGFIIVGVMLAFCTGGDREFTAKDVANCPVPLAEPEIAKWAQAAVVRAFLFKIDVPVAQSSSPLLFSKRGWSNFISANMGAGIITDTGLNRGIHPDHLELAVNAAPVVQVLANGTNSVPKFWQVDMLTTIGSADALLAGDMKLRLTLSCANKDATPPLAIEQWIMQTDSDLP